MLLGHRYYDASVGRFLSRDPIHAGDNWYAYCNNDPVNSTDSNGLDIDIKIGDVIITIGANPNGPTVIITLPGLPPSPPIPIPIPPSPQPPGLAPEIPPKPPLDPTPPPIATPLPENPPPSLPPGTPPVPGPVKGKIRIGQVEVIGGIGKIGDIIRGGPKEGGIEVDYRPNKDKVWAFRYTDKGWGIGVGGRF